MAIRLLRNRNFILLWSSQILSQLSINIMNFIVLVHIFESTNSTIAASFVWVAYGVPAIIIGPIAAAAVDLFDKRKILMIANLVQAVEIFIYAILLRKFIYLSYGIVAAYSLMDQLYVPAESASLPSLVNKKNLAQANGLFFISAQSAALLGFEMAGLISEVIGFQITMLLGSVMLLTAFASTYFLPRLKSASLKKSKSVEEKFYEFLGRMKEGFVFIRHNNTILFPFLFLMWLQISLAMLVVNLPEIGVNILKTKPSLAGPLVVGPAGIGALIGTLLIPRILKRGIRKVKIVEISLVVMAFSFLMVVFTAPVFEFWIGRLILITCFAFIGATYVCALIPSMTYMQTQTPNKLMGRLFGNFWFITNTATLIPVMFSATITELLGVNLMILLLGFMAMGILFLLKTYAYPAISE